MTYATLDHLTDRFGQTTIQRLSDRSTPPAGAIDADVVERALMDADAIIDSYLLGRYVLPLETTPSVLIDIAVSIAIYKLHVTSAPDKIAADYKEALASLDKIGKGVMRLQSAGVEPKGSDAGGVMTTDRERPMTAENLKGFV